MTRALLPLLLAVLTATAAAPPDLSAVDARRRARERDAADVRGQADETAREVADLRRQLVALGTAERAGEQAVGAGRGRLRLLNAREAELSARIGANQVELARLLGALQMYQRHPPPALLVDPRSARQAVEAAILMRAIAPELAARGRGFRQEAEELQRLRRGVAAASGALFEAESDVADRRARIEGLIDQKRALEQRLYADAAKAETEARRLADQARSMGELVRDLPSAAGADEGEGPSRLTLPVQGLVERRFGDAWPGRGRSRGWSWRTLPGAPVLSPAAGRVDYAGPLKGWGEVVILSIGGGWRTVLAGLGRADAGVGRDVAAGEPVGRMPSPGPMPVELYLELRRADAPRDPAPLFAAAPAPIATSPITTTPR